MQLSKIQISLWVFLLVLLSASLMTPFAIVGFFLIAVPMLVLRLAQVSRNVFSAAMIAAFIAPTLLVSSGIWLTWVAWVYLFLMLLPVTWMTNAYKRGGGARGPLTVGTIGVTVMLVLIYLILINVYPNLLDAYANQIRELFASMPSDVKSTLKEDAVNAYIDIALNTIPMVMVIFALMITSLTHTLTRRVFRRYGVALPELVIADEWKVPRSWVIIYFVALLIDMLSPTNTQAFISVALLNLVPLMMVAFSVQAIGFLVYVARYKRWAKVAPYFAVILYPFISGLIVLLGILDVAFPIRRRLNKNEG